MLSGWGWLNTFLALIVPSLASPFAIFVFRQFFITMPRDFEEAATVDGAGLTAIFFSIALPLAGPAIATVFILTFLGEWSNLLKPLVFNHVPDMYTLQQGLAITLNKGANLSPDIATTMAGVVLTSIVPVVDVPPRTALLRPQHRLFRHQGLSPQTYEWRELWGRRLVASSWLASPA